MKSGLYSAITKETIPNFAAVFPDADRITLAATQAIIEGTIEATRTGQTEKPATCMPCVEREAPQLSSRTVGVLMGYIPGPEVRKAMGVLDEEHHRIARQVLEQMDPGELEKMELMAEQMLGEARHPEQDAR